MEPELSRTPREVVEQLVEAGDFALIDAAVRRLSIRAVQEGVLIKVISRGELPREIRFS